MKGLFKEVLNTLIALRDNDPENLKPFIKDAYIKVI